jgi:hypothetical protein
MPGLRLSGPLLQSQVLLRDLPPGRVATAPRGTIGRVRQAATTPTKGLRVPRVRAALPWRVAMPRLQSILPWAGPWRPLPAL